MKSKNKTGFTLAEIMIVVAIISIIVFATMKITQSKLSFGSRMMYYAAFSNLEKISTELIGQGCKSTDTTLCASPKSLPLRLHNTSADVLKEGGFCDRMADMLNTINSANCAAASVTAETTDFSTITPNFTLTNGMKFYMTTSGGATSGGGDPDPCQAGETEVNGYCVTQKILADSLYAGQTGVDNEWKAGMYCCNLNFPSYSAYTDEYRYHLPPADPTGNSLLSPIFGTLSDTFFWSAFDATGGNITIKCGVDVDGYPANACNWGWYYIKSGATEGIYTSCVRKKKPIPITTVGFIVYVDINGAKGKSKLNEDVFKFLIYPDGTVLPAGDSKGSTDSGFFSASAKNATGANIVSHVSYKEAVCKAGKVDTTKITDYCGTFAPVTECPYGTSNECKVITNKPGY